MKKLTALIFVCALAGSTPAQTDSIKTKTPRPFRHELGMNLYAMTVDGGDFYSKYKPVANNYVFNGVYLKFYYRKSAWRFAANYLQKIINTGANAFYTTNHGVVSSKSLQFSVGYQRLLGKARRRVVPYLLADLAGERRRDVRLMTAYVEPFDNFAGYSVNTFIPTWQVSLSPGVGLRIHLGKNILLNLESTAQFFYAVEGSQYGGKNKMVGVTARPLQCSMGFGF